MCVIYPTLTRSTPQFEIIPQPRTSDESQQSETMICWREDKENAQSQREPGKGLVKGWEDKDQHQA